MLLNMVKFVNDFEYKKYTGHMGFARAVSAYTRAALYLKDVLSGGTIRFKA